MIKWTAIFIGMLVIGYVVWRSVQEQEASDEQCQEKIEDDVKRAERNRSGGSGSNGQ